ncbi:MAG: ribonuclease H-like domain-containing protein [Candidatus Dadabacteria bacterium]
MGKKTKKVLKYLMDNPGTKTSTVAAATGVSKRLVRYAKESMRGIGDSAKILFLDIETSPCEVYVWGLYKQQIPIGNLIKDWSLLSYAAMWLGDDEIISERVTTTEAHDRTDYNMLLGLWTLLNTADIVVAHNGVRFDVRKINARFVEFGIIPPAPYQVVDTLKVVQRNFYFTSHKLEHVAKILDTEIKDKTTFDLWKRCVTGDESALIEMEKYNRQDVVVLKEVYLAIRPWIKSHANLGLYTDHSEPVCANCGSAKLIQEDKLYITPANKYVTYRCEDCGAISRSRYSSLTKEDRKNLIISVAR